MNNILIITAAPCLLKYCDKLNLTNEVWLI